MSTSTIYQSSTLSKRKNIFLEKVVYIHNFKYDYSKVVYINSRTKVEIICPEHGSFFQKPNDHSNGSGCWECTSTFKKNTKWFIKDAHKIHGDRYNYSKVNYKNNRDKIEIICSIHGSFWQKPNNHLTGQNCMECYLEERENLSHLIDENDLCYLYEIKLSGNGESFYKTGIAKDYKHRHNIVNKDSGYDIEVINLLIDTRYNCKVLEDKLLVKRQRIKKYIPMIKFGGWTECYIK